MSEHLEPVDLPFRLSLEAPKRPIQHVYFPEDGLVSVVAMGARDQTIEVGIIGRDGMTGSAVLLGTDRTPYSCHMQIAGYGTRVAVDPLRLALERSLSLRTALLLFVQAFSIQAGLTALANGRAKLESRLARWLLMAHDRLDTDRIALTHEFLAVMLGVRRPSVTVALQKLEASRFIETQRHAITIRDRAGLEAMADGIYSVAETEQTRLTGWHPLHRRSYVD